MDLSTTPVIAGKKVIEHKGLVYGDSATGIDIAQMTSIPFGLGFGLEGTKTETFDVGSAKQTAVDTMVHYATQWGANAIVGIRFDIELIGRFLLVSVSGTAVIVE